MRARYTMILIAIYGATPAYSQTSNESIGTLEEVIVTARKVQENLQDTPIAISAFSGDSLDERQVFATNKLTELVPNLQFANNAPLAGNNSSSQVFIRGIGQTDPTSTVDPGVGLYIDDVYIGTAVGGTMTLRDIDNVQVLRGPQGTLFGRNTIGGAILLNTRDPGSEFGGNGTLGFGSDSLVNAFVGIDLPLSSATSARITAGLRKQDGYVTRSDGTDLGDTNTYTLTGKLIWQPSDRFTGRFLVDYTKADENGSPLVFAFINTAATFPRVASADAGCPGFNGNFATLPAVPNVNDARCANNFQARGPYANNGTAPLTSQLENWGLSMNLAWKLNDAVTLKSISAYRSLAWLGNRDADNTPLTILHTYYNVDGSQFSQELQLTRQTERMTGVVGAYYFTQKSDDIATIELNPPPPGVQRDSDNNKVDNESWALFTQWTYRFNDRLSATVGGRYTNDKKGSYPDQYDFATPTVKQVPMQWYRDTFTSFTPSASLAWRWNERAMTYLSYAEGFKGGGWNSHFNSVLTAAQQAALQKFDQEEARTIEAGFKLDLAGNTLRLNGAIFNSDYTDMQLTYRGPFIPPPGTSGVAPFILNAGKAGISGAELELLWSPTSDLAIDASIGTLDATIDRLELPAAAVLPPGLVVGNVLPYAPKTQAHAGIAYTLHTSNLKITPRADVSFQSKTFFDATNTVEIAQLDSNTVLNLSLAIAPPEKKWRLMLGINNVTDEEYPIAGNSSLTTGSGYAEIAYARPREYFATLNIDF